MTPAGGTLDDCHTNVIILTELSGLKWKCLTTAPNFRPPTTSASSSTSSDSQQNSGIDSDVVLRAYSECLSEGLLSTWRRRPKFSDPNSAFEDPTPKLDVQKELWVFWYAQDEPKELDAFKSQGLIEATDYESYDGGVNYETRVLFFKALHNAIERNLVRFGGYTRFGKWFTQPLELPTVLMHEYRKALPQYVNGINFNFFIHGENLVCMTVNIQRQPTMVRLSRRHLDSPRGQPVVLGPWSIKARLLPNQPLLIAQNEAKSENEGEADGKHHKKKSKKNAGENPCLSLAEIQAVVNQQWSDWKRFHALPSDDSDEDLTFQSTSASNSNETKSRKMSSVIEPNQPSKLPKMVLVDIDGVEMFYPSCFVGLLADEMNMDSPSSIVTRNKMDDDGISGIGNPILASAGIYNAEDHEVEEILNSSLGSTSSALDGHQKQLLSRSRKSIPDPLRHCRRSFAGVRAAQRSFEDGCLSALMNNSVAPVDINTPGTSNANETMEQTMQVDTRWNFVDYLRREYCYCRMCSSGNSTGSGANDDIPSSSSRDSYPFHRSPISLECVTPDHSPTFIDELKSLKELQWLKPVPPTTAAEKGGKNQAEKAAAESSHDSDVLPVWAQHNNRPTSCSGKGGSSVSATGLLIGGRLELERGESAHADVLKALQSTARIQAGQIQTGEACEPRAMTPFTPITSITPEPIDDPLFSSADSSLQQKLKDFSFTHNPLKRDVVGSTEYYHLVAETSNNNGSEQKAIGPPPGGFQLLQKKQCLADKELIEEEEDEDPSANQAKSTSSGISILKSLLDSNMDEPTPPMFGEASQANSYFPADDRTASTSLMGYHPTAGSSQSTASRFPPVRLPKHKRNRRAHGEKKNLPGCRRRAKWPSIDVLDPMFSAVYELNEESASFVMESDMSNCAPYIPEGTDICNPNDFFRLSKYNGLHDASTSQRSPRPGGHHVMIERLENPNVRENVEGSTDVLLQLAEDSMDPTEANFNGQEDEDIVGQDIGDHHEDDAEAMELSDSMTAVTPPALLNRPMMNSNHPNEEDDEDNEDDDTEFRNALARARNDAQRDAVQRQVSLNSPASSGTMMDPTQQQHPTSTNSCDTGFTPSTAALVSAAQHPLVGSDHMHFLSPPASNERIDSGLFPAGTMPPGTVPSISTMAMGQQTTLFNAMGTPMLAHDSLSIIYPTPPTPMQQFSPQNVILTAQQLMAMEATTSAAHIHRTPQNLEDFCSASPLAQGHFRKLQITTEPIFDGSSSVKAHPLVTIFPQSESFSGDLFDQSAEVEERLRTILPATKQWATSTVSVEDREKVRTGLLSREEKRRQQGNDVKMESAPSYKPAPGDRKLQRQGTRECNGSEIKDRIIATDLEQREMHFLANLSSKSSQMAGFGAFGMMQMQYGNNFGGAPPPYGQISSMGQLPMNGMPFPNQTNTFLPGNMMSRPGQNFPARFPPGMTPQQMMQKHLQNQMLMKNTGVTPTGSLMGSPSVQPPFPPNSNPLAIQQQQQMMQQQQFLKHQNTGQFMPPNSAIDQHGSASGMPGSNQKYQAQNTMNHFGSPPLLNMQNSMNTATGSPSSMNSPSIFNTPGSTSGMDCSGAAASLAQSPFGSPSGPGSIAMARQLSMSSLNIPQQSGSLGRIPSGMNPMDYQLSSVSSTSSSIAGGLGVNTTSSGGFPLSGSTTLFNAINFGAIINSLQNGRSFVIAVLMQDTVIDLHYDAIFDACPICCCNANIRAYEIGLYINPSEEVAKSDEIQRRQQQDSNFMPEHWSGFRVAKNDLSQTGKCSCGFSAVRHRYLCGMGSSAGLRGLFPDDIKEACADRTMLPSNLLSRNAAVSREVWFNPANEGDMHFIDLLRHQCLFRDIAAVIRTPCSVGEYVDEALFDYMGKRSIFEQSVAIGGDSTSDYVISRVDSVEANQILSSIIGMAVSPSEATKDINRPSKTQNQSVFHPWGIQIANRVMEPKESEYMAEMRELLRLLEGTMSSARRGAQSSKVKFNGPLTWRSFLKKTSNKVNASLQDDSEGGSGQVEPIPNVIAATEREPVVTNPQLVHLWEKLSLAPYDQTKDILYLAVVPDTNVVVEKCRVFLEELSSIYEKCRFGIHVKVQTKDAPRDAILRLGHYRAQGPQQGNGSLHDFLKHFEGGKHVEDRKAFMAKLKGYTENLEQELTQFFRTTCANLFDRRAYHESVYRHNQKQNFTSLATSSDSSSMPPPALPIQSPSSVLSSASGPASGGMGSQFGQNQLPNQLLPQSGQVPSGTAVSPNATPQSQPSLTSAQPGQPSPKPPGGLDELSQDNQGQGPTPNAQQQQQLDQQQANAEANIENAVEQQMSVENPNYLPHVIVIYLVNPFSFGSEAHQALFSRVATVALMRVFNAFLYQLDTNRRPQIQLELISMQSLLDYTAFAADPLREHRQSLETLENFSSRDKTSAQDCLRKIAFSVFSQSRLVIPEFSRGALPKSMTRFGPASSLGDVLNELKERPLSQLYKVPSSPMILAPNRSSIASSSRVQASNSEERVLFVTYCLVADEWLCGAVTDEHGHLLDNVLINLVVPLPSQGDTSSAKWKYKNQSQIVDAIQRLWHYIQSVLVMETKNWRIVVGRLGKIGHGEFKAWTEILSRRNLRAYNNRLKNLANNAGTGCRPCSMMPGYAEMPAILSACLISTEPELNLRVLPSSLQFDGANGGNGGYSSMSYFSNTLGGKGAGSGFASNNSSKTSKGKSPPQWQSTVGVDDTSITHIMVFPTMLYISFEHQLDAGNKLDQEAMNDDAFDDFFDEKFDHDILNPEDLQMMCELDNDTTRNGEESEATIDNQPMATGYYISTAPALDLPEWFWSSCPSARFRQPVHLKSSLHMHTANVQQNDDVIPNKSEHSTHPLDSIATDEVLRYVLEKYNALSWLNVDFSSGARLSCLPIHIQAQLRLYKAVTTLFS